MCARVARRSIACALVLLLAAGCGGSDAAQEPDAEAADDPAAVEVVEPIEPPAPKPVAAPLADPLEGTWWVLAPALPYMAFRATLVAPQPPGDELTGSWVSFDWRGSSESDGLMRLSKPVKVKATRNGDQLVIDAPSPMLDANGSPNGHSGIWSLSLRRASLPGEALRYAGRARHPGSPTARARRWTSCATSAPGRNHSGPPPST
ncbi:MAG: hypothetical protein ACYTCU_10590 [Planctomycetota bacterium]